MKRIACSTYCPADSQLHEAFSQQVERETQIGLYGPPPVDLPVQPRFQLSPELQPAECTDLGLGRSRRANLVPHLEKSTALRFAYLSLEVQLPL
ncbi:MAG TPA: hypothetical protein VG759_20880 [Candidatus Angelobacter sp.]|nr:hypothetical protein [Candidatus Angelobacter sp.]